MNDPIPIVLTEDVTCPSPNALSGRLLLPAGGVYWTPNQLERAGPYGLQRMTIVAETKDGTAFILSPWQYRPASALDLLADAAD